MPREDIPIRAGHVIARPPGTGVSHAFLAGSTGLTMLIYGTRLPGDTAWYPRSQKIAWRGLGVIGRIESLDYDDGEPARVGAASSRRPHEPGSRVEVSWREVVLRAGEVEVRPSRVEDGG